MLILTQPFKLHKNNPGRCLSVFYGICALQCVFMHTMYLFKAVINIGYNNIQKKNV